MYKKIAIGLAIALAATMAQAAILTSAADGLWSATATWGTAGAVPSALDTARVNTSVTVDSNVGTVTLVTVGRDSLPGNLTVTTGGTLSSSANGIIGDTSVGHATLSGGTLNIAGALNIGNVTGGAGGSTLTMSSGTLTVGTILALAKADDASITMTGGNISTKSLNMGQSIIQTNDLGEVTNTVHVADATFNLYGGSLTFTTNTAGAITFKTAASVMDIQNGAELIWGGNQWAAIDTFINNGNITWDNGSGVEGVGDKTWDNGTGSYIHTAYDGTDTTVWVNQTIPEPATVGMLGLGALIMMLIRRMRG